MGNRDILKMLHDYDNSQLKLGMEEKDYGSDLAYAKHFAEKYHCNYNYGANKICFSFKHDNIVYKIGRAEMFTDVCKLEYDIYQDAISDGIELIFPKTQLVGKLPSGNVVISQQKVPIVVDDLPTSRYYALFSRYTANISSDLSDKISSCCYDNFIDDLWLKMAIFCYGKKFLRKFENFTHTYQINDLHDHNLGYIGKRPVVLDFCGYIHE